MLKSPPQTPSWCVGLLCAHGGAAWGGELPHGDQPEPAALLARIALAGGCALAGVLLLHAGRVDRVAAPALLPRGDGRHRVALPRPTGLRAVLGRHQLPVQPQKKGSEKRPGSRQGVADCG